MAAVVAFLVAVGAIWAMGQVDGSEAEVDRLGLVDDEAADEVQLGESGAWQLFENADTGFRIELPGTASVEKVPTSGAAAGLDIFAASVGSDHDAHLVSWTEAIGAYDLDGAVEGVALNIGGQVVSTEPTTLAGMDARRFRVESEDLTYLSVAASDGLFLYQLAVLGDSDPSPADLDRMVASFALVP